MLDVGCGCGGDINKWFNQGVIPVMCDPDYTSLMELKKRLRENSCRVYHGDIHSIPVDEQFDVICYNFSLQYIFETEECFKNTIQCIKNHLKLGGKLIGCIPNSDFIIMNPKFKDDMGNYIIRKDTRGQFGEKLFVHLAYTPYYKTGPKPEPIAHKDILVTSLQELGIHLLRWKPFESMYDISKMYAEFIFVRVY